MKNVVISVNLNDESLNLLKTLKGSPLLEDSQIHFVHCFEVQVYTSDFTPYIYPTEEKYPEIRKSVLTIIDNLSREICTPAELPKVQSHCFFSQSPKQKMVDYLKEIKADLVVVATRGKHGIAGLFSSSFTEHLTKYSPCDLMVLRHKE